MVTLLSSLGRLRQRLLTQLLSDVVDLDISEGPISRRQSIGRKTPQPGYEEITTDVRNSAVAKMDETSWRDGSLKGWRLWVA